MHFTQTVVKSLLVPATGEKLYWADSPKGFGVRVSANGKRAYIVQGRPNGVSRRVTIGEHGVFTLVQAQERANDILRDMRNGIDPKNVKKEAAAKQERDKAELTTLRQVLEEYIANADTPSGPLREASKYNIRRFIEKGLPDWLDKPAKDITPDMCLKRLNLLSTKGVSGKRGTPAQASLVMTHLRSLLTRARTTHRASDGTYTILAFNPVTMMLEQKRLHPDNPRNGRIPLNKVGASWSAVYARRSEYDARTSADYVLFIMLTGLRRTEASLLTWSNVDFNANTWTIPKEDAKSRVALTLPFSTPARELIEARPRVKGNDYVFASYGKCGHIQDGRSMLDEIDRAAGVHISFHDLRRTYEDIARHCGVDSDTRRRLLNHVGADVHAVHYSNNPDPQVFATPIEKIGVWVMEQVAIANSSNVLEMRSA